MSEFATATSNVSEELASLIWKGVQSFCEFFNTDQFDKMAQFYAPDTTLMLPNRPAVRGADKLAAVFRELKQAGLHDWRIEPARIEQYGDTALEFGIYTALVRQSSGLNTAERGKYLVV